MDVQLLQFKQVLERVAIEESLSGGAPVDICAWGGGGGLVGAHTRGRPLPWGGGLVGHTQGADPYHGGGGLVGAHTRDRPLPLGGWSSGSTHKGQTPTMGGGLVGAHTRGRPLPWGVV